MNTPSPEDALETSQTVDLDTVAAHLIERLQAFDNLLPQPGDAAGFSPEFFDALYTLGVRYYANRQYDKAHPIFRMLCQLQPIEVRHFKAWGANYLGTRDYRSAVNAYACAYMLSATDADTSFYLGQAFFFLKEYEEAAGHLRYARELAQRNPALWPGIEAWAGQLLERIDARQQT